jgi:hypothetical protein
VCSQFLRSDGALCSVYNPRPHSEFRYFSAIGSADQEPAPALSCAYSIYKRFRPFNSINQSVGDLGLIHFFIRDCHNASTWAAFPELVGQMLSGRLRKRVAQKQYAAVALANSVQSVIFTRGGHHIKSGTLQDCVSKPEQLCIATG